MVRDETRQKSGDGMEGEHQFQGREITWEVMAGARDLKEHVGWLMGVPWVTGCSRWI